MKLILALAFSFLMAFSVTAAPKHHNHGGYHKHHKPHYGHQHNARRWHQNRWRHRHYPHHRRGPRLVFPFFFVW